MQISCPQCSMQYALDPRLLPPGGVPVECTRCRHVFIAAPPAPAAPQKPPVTGSPAVPRPAQNPNPQANPNLNSTLPYGAGKTAPQPSIGATQAFGAVPQVPPVAPVAPAGNRPQPAPAGMPPSAMTTQVFGAVPQVPPVAPVGPRPQPAPAGMPPSAMTTQAFGAVPQVPAAAPVGNRPPPAAKPPPAARPPPAGAAPPPQTTQVFGAVPQPQGNKPPTPSTAQFLVVGTEGVESSAGPRPQPARPPSATTPPFGSTPQQMAPGATRPPAGSAPAPQTTQVFGAVPQPGPQAPAAPPPSAATTQLFASVPLPSTQAGGTQGPQPGQTAAGPTSQPPGLTPRATTQDRLPAVPAPDPFRSEPMVGVAVGTPIELPDEILDQLNRPLAELMAEGSSSEDRGPVPVVGQSGPLGPALSKPLELPAELLDGSVDINQKGSRDKRPESGLKGRGLLIAGGVLVLVLTAFLTSPAWLTKSDALPHEARAAKDEAVALLRRDDAASKEEALTRLKALSAAHPRSVELQAEVGVALGMHLDDTQARVSTLKEKAVRLQSRISLLTQAQKPFDWQSRVNAMREELAATQRELLPIEDRGKVLSKDAVQALKLLESAPEKESREDGLARLRGRALLNGSLGGDEALGMAVKLSQADLSDWSTLTMAEYVLHGAKPSETQVKEAADSLERLREKDKTFLRAYVLGARIALLRKEPAAAQALLDTVITLNPKHELARQLHAHAREVAKQEPAPAPAPELESTPSSAPDASTPGSEATPTSPDPEATTPTPAPEATPTP
ncbi:zinc-ribbon domain-containing protein [Vitiosangium sp. GDMCC 1.1324]|uniref:zinc-ribbon domain-containing protein n=1 Tax=Vitiosangium sp. (strain GDMCC 1.1324) TaxID=2138576 RepID=UPI000D3DA384|nr:zinc-ribbon domain-containing protein [Vitiosangium sp. GDMCC 1.1324]PTL76914.1 hypothetical protein DAT35_47465 [Vitiosangium sp. GDMCC 1.1324]